MARARKVAGGAQPKRRQARMLGLHRDDIPGNKIGELPLLPLAVLLR